MVMSEIRVSLRRLLRSPGYAVAAVVSLGAGIAVAVAALSLVNALVFNDVAGLRDRRTLVRLQWTGGNNAFTTPELDALETRTWRAFGPLAAQGDRDLQPARRRLYRELLSDWVDAVQRGASGRDSIAAMRVVVSEIDEQAVDPMAHGVVAALAEAETATQARRRAVADAYATFLRSQAALDAGCDVALICNSPDKADLILAGLTGGTDAASAARRASLLPCGEALDWEALQADARYLAARALVQLL